MMVWKMIVLFQGARILRFHVNLPGCKNPDPFREKPGLWENLRFLRRRKCGQPRWSRISGLGSKKVIFFDPEALGPNTSGQSTYPWANSCSLNKALLRLDFGGTLHGGRLTSHDVRRIISSSHERAMKISGPWFSLGYCLGMKNYTQVYRDYS